MWVFPQKPKRLSKTLMCQSKKEFGDVFLNIKNYEEKVKAAEQEFILHNSDHNRTNLHEINAKYIKILKLEDKISKQKTQMHWFKEGDTNSKYILS